MNNAFVLISMINIKKIHRTILGLIISAIVILANIFCAYLPVAAATPTTTTINSGSSTFTIPNGVFSMYVELWGAGGFSKVARKEISEWLAESVVDVKFRLEPPPPPGDLQS